MGGTTDLPMRSLFTFGCLLMFTATNQANGRPLSTGDQAIQDLLGDDSFTLRLWPDGPPDEVGPTPEEVVRPKDETDATPFLDNVADPTMTVLLPKPGDTPTPALVVFPGGGYMTLGIDAEGADAAKWMQAMGGAGIVVKHWVPRRESGYEKHHHALQDAQRAVGLVRQNATAWNIDPHRIGVIGFSAGGHLAASLSNNYKQRIYPKIDDADRFDCRPDFVILIYGAYLTDPTDSDTIDPLQQEERMSAERTPPTFLAAGQEDAHTRGSIRYYSALRNAGVPAEMHVYLGNNHGGGMRMGPLTRWPEAARLWLQDLSLIE